jgi:predicted ester cyclase
MTAEERKALIRRFYDEAWNRGEYGVIDELFASAFVAPTPEASAGPESERRHVATIRAVFPDLRVQVEELVAEGETVVVRWTMTGTDTGGFMGRPPTGREAQFWGVDFFRFAGRRIAASWTGVDMLGLMVELGIVPSPWRVA